MDCIRKVCHSCHKDAEHQILSKGKGRKPSPRYVCVDCFRVISAKRMRKRVGNGKQLKRLAVEYFGGRCGQCGLEDECLAVYAFHHKDPKQKDFTIAAWLGHLVGSIPSEIKSLDEVPALLAELSKCQMLCLNCHARVHHPV